MGRGHESSHGGFTWQGPSKTPQPYPLYNCYSAHTTYVRLISCNSYILKFSNLDCVQNSRFSFTHYAFMLSSTYRSTYLNLRSESRI